MKRILFLLLLTVSVYGQNPSRFAKIQITGNANSGTATKVNVQEANGVVNTQTINTGFNKNIGLGGSDVVGANTLLNQYSNTPTDWTAQTYTLGSVVFYGGKQWIAKIATVASDVPNSSSKWEEITFDAIKNDLDSKAPISSVHNPVTIGNANGLSLATQQLSLGLASSGVTGALSGTDWTTFNGKFNTPTGLTTNYLPKWNGSGFGNSQIFDNGISLDYSTNLGSLTSSFFSFKDNFTNRIIKIGVNSGIPSIQSLVFSNSAPFTFLINPEGGNTLFGKTDDNGVDKVQVNGTITASPAVSPNQVVVKSQLDAVGRPYKVYTALLSQSGTNAPTAIVLENSLGGTVVWSRSNAGFYLGTLTGAFTASKTYCVISTASLAWLNKLSSNTTNDVLLQTSNLSGTLQDDKLLQTSIEIRVYN